MQRVVLKLAESLLYLMHDDCDMVPAAIHLRRALREYIKFKNGESTD